MKLRAVIFDFNGVLLFDSHVHDQVWSHFAAEHFGRQVSERELESFHGKPCAATVNYLAGERKLEQEEITRFIALREEAYQAECLKLIQNGQLSLSPGAIELFETLKTRGMAFTIATSSDFRNLGFYMEHLHLGNWFDRAKIAFEDGTFKGKPEPDIYWKAAEKMGVAASESVIFEDSLAGLKGATRAGAGLVVEVWPMERHAILKANGAQKTLVELREFSLDWLL